MNPKYYMSPFVKLVTSSPMPYPKLVIHDGEDTRTDGEKNFHTAYRLFLQQLVDFITEPHVSREEQQQLLVLLEKLIQAKASLDNNR